MTGLVRGAFVNLFVAKPNPSGILKYGMTMLIDPTDPMLKLMKEAAQEAAVAKWGDKIPKKLNSPFRNGDDKEYQGFAGNIFVAATASEENKPGIVDAMTPPREITDASQCYSGAWYRCVINAFAYDKAGNIGVAFGLNHVQKVADDEAFSGRGSATSAFDGIINPDAPDAFKADDKKVDADVSGLFD
jgi:hypothetical protein